MKDRMIVVNSNCYHGYSIEQAIAGIAKAGFTNIELTATKGWTEHVFVDQRFSRLLHVKNLLHEYGLRVVAMSGHANLMDAKRLEDFIQNIYLAHFYGCTFIVSSIGEAHLEDKAEVGDERLVEHLKGLLPHLKETNLTLVLETHGDHATAGRIAQIVTALGDRRVQVCYDTANVIFFANEMGTDDLAKHVDSVGYLHIKDKAGEPQEWNFPALGEGYVDFPALFAILDAANNPSPLSIEIEFKEGGSSSVEEVDEALLTSAEYLQSLGYTL